MATSWPPRLAAWQVACDVGRHRAPAAAGQHLRAAPPPAGLHLHRGGPSAGHRRRPGAQDARGPHPGVGHALAVIPASRRLDLHLVRDALGDHQARLASEEDLARDFAGYQLGALPPLGPLLGSQVVIDPEVPEHDLVGFAAGSQTESVRMRTQELFAGEQATTVPLVKQADRGSDAPTSRRRAAQQDLAGGGHPAPERAPNRRQPTGPSGLPDDTGSSLSRD